MVSGAGRAQTRPACWRAASSPRYRLFIYCRHGALAPWTRYSRLPAAGVTRGQAVRRCVLLLTLGRLVPCARSRCWLRCGSGRACAAGVPSLRSPVGVCWARVVAAAGWRIGVEGLAGRGCAAAGSLGSRHLCAVPGDVSPTALGGECVYARGDD